MEYERILSTTHVVNRGIYFASISKEALEDAVSQLNGAFAMPVILNHDPLCMPIGKIKSAWLSQLEDGEWALYAQIYEDDAPTLLTINHHTDNYEKEDIVALTFPGDKRPFISRHKVNSTTLNVIVDHVNFRDMESFESFRDEILHDYSEVSVSVNARYELIPEPLVEFIVQHFSLWSVLAWSAGGWFLYRLEKPCRYVIDETLQEVANGIVNSIRPKIQGIFKRFQNRPSEDDRETLVGIHLNGRPTIRLYARINSADTFPDINLPEIVETLNQYSHFMVEAQEVVLEWTDDGWHFRFVISNEGEVVATQDCYNYTMAEYKRLLEIQRKTEGNSPHGS